MTTALLPASVVGHSMPVVTFLVERGRLRLFAKAVRLADPIYTDVAAARAAGHRDLVVPPTFLFGLDMERDDPFGWMKEVGVDLACVLHGSQRFDYHSLAYAGDVLHAQATLTDVYVKKAGALEFIDRTIAVTRDGESIATLLSTTVIRHEQAA